MAPGEVEGGSDLCDALGFGQVGRGRCLHGTSLLHMLCLLEFFGYEDMKIVRPCAAYFY